MLDNLKPNAYDYAGIIIYQHQIVLLRYKTCFIYTDKISFSFSCYKMNVIPVSLIAVRNATLNYIPPRENHITHMLIIL